MGYSRGTVGQRGIFWIEMHEGGFGVAVAVFALWREVSTPTDLWGRIIIVDLIYIYLLERWIPLTIRLVYNLLSINFDIHVLNREYRLSIANNVILLHHLRYAVVASHAAVVLILNQLLYLLSGWWSKHVLIPTWRGGVTHSTKDWLLLLGLKVLVGLLENHVLTHGGNWFPAI